MAGHGGRPTEWVVLLEAAERSGRSIDPAGFGRLLAFWTTPTSRMLCSPDRYALQVPIQACDPSSALASAMWLWRDALRRAALPEWQLVRAEVVTPDELEQEWRTAEQAESPASEAPGPSGFEDLLADELLRAALHDEVTGLPNRELFLDKVRSAGAGAPSPSSRRVVLVVRLDLPDGSTEGRVADEMLVETAGRLIASLRGGDTVARVGPADFGLLVDVGGAEDFDGLAHRIVTLVRRPMSRDNAVCLNGHVGLAASPNGADPDDVLLLAERAMAVASQRGRKGYFCVPEPTGSPSGDRGTSEEGSEGTAHR